MIKRFYVRSLRPGDEAVHEESINAASEEILRTELQSQGLAVLSVRKQITVSTFSSTGRKEATHQRYPLFCREVRTLIQAGMTVVEAVDTLCARERILGQSGSLASKLLVKLQQGLSLSNALNGMPETPAVLVAAVRSGERTSNLVEALDDYLRYDKLTENLRRKVVSAAIYPALVATLGLAVSLFLLIVVLPNFSRMYQNLRGEATGLTAMIIKLSQVINLHQEVTLSALVILSAVLFWCVHIGLVKKWGLVMCSRIPWIQAHLEDFELAMMYQALSLLLKGGYPMTEAVGVAAEAAFTPKIRGALQQALEHINQGGSVSQAFAQAYLCDEVGRRLMAAAERNGSFHLASEVVSRMHGERFELFIERTTRIVEPLLLMAVALVVGTLVVAMYLPVFDMATRLR